MRTWTAATLAHFCIAFGLIVYADRLAAGLYQPVFDVFRWLTPVENRDVFRFNPGFNMGILFLGAILYGLITACAVLMIARLFRRDMEALPSGTRNTPNAVGAENVLN